MKTLNEVLRSREFNQDLGKLLVLAAKGAKAKAYKEINEAGLEVALKEMANWGSTELKLVYVRDYLEELFDLDINAEHIDELNEKEFDAWCKRSDEYEADKKKAVIPRTGYEKWFLDKWFR